ncbi:MAG: YbaK/prolyl-tRNA synthetase associated region [Candidatus Moranbacteria bacterium GW2011_GWE1_35_17]|nr:MAG: YbaK/prolyl-tRNA synthetase associated region [Candidatus Moranbacteria bacterium GW2011_GWE1_35_17]KKP81943.1 MAG: YbaK/prolyl-tRNA synthetase associated region [Candidatus Moranbacteria bacterium GW2011_GWF1_35_5]KKP83204.1 MAG: YbaK/prolyl-tRNA synthetase associated region [Candidatus Moranbacteria bacterium GW2011_GWF2_35_54]
MNDIYKILKDLGISFKEYNHPAVFTVEEALLHKGEIDGAKIKNLFLRNKKGDKHFLFITDAFKDIDLKKLSEVTGERKLGFASLERLQKYLKLTPGSVSPLGIINDVSKEVTILLDKELLYNNDKLNFHPNINTSTIQISKDDFYKFLRWAGNEVKEIEI